MAQEDQTNRPANLLVENSLRSLRKDYLIVARHRVKSWHAWLVIGLTIGVVTGVILVANRNGEFEAGKAAPSESEVLLPLFEVEDASARPGAAKNIPPADEDSIPEGFFE